MFKPGQFVTNIRKPMFVSIGERIEYWVAVRKGDRYVAATDDIGENERPKRYRTTSIPRGSVGVVIASDVSLWSSRDNDRGDGIVGLFEETSIYLPYDDLALAYNVNGAWFYVGLDGEVHHIGEVPK